ncbi:MAG TPA: four helix bundle protein [Bacteroidales bacterium]|nr:four helix bundle protein [Bacteroidales bacterium]
MGVSRFEELIVWQEAKVFCIEVYKVFEHSKDFGFKDQIQRASVSIMNNITEGSSIKRKVIKFESFSVDTTDSKAKSKLYHFLLSTFHFLLSTFLKWYSRAICISARF